MRRLKAVRSVNPERSKPMNFPSLPSLGEPLAPLMMRLGRMLIGKNLPSLSRWAATVLGSMLVTLGLLTPEAMADGFQFGEIGMAIVGLGLMLESRVNNWLRGRTLYGIDLGGASVLIGRGFTSLARWAMNALGAYLTTVGAIDATPDAIANLPMDTVAAGVILMLSTRVWSYLEARLKGELPEQVEERRLESLFESHVG